jgi:lipopolysaccharide transport system permease protein
MFTFVFGQVAKISTDGLPQPLFYLSGLLLWGYFTDCFGRTSNVFVSNAGIFGKVYFPRLVSPLSFIISSLMRFSSQIILFIILWCYFYFSVPDAGFNLRIEALLFPVLVLMMAGFALGLGLIVSSFSTKYRDLGILMSFFIGLLQYATCVIYPLSAVPEKYRFLVQLNPLTSIIETFRYSFMGVGHFSWLSLLYSLVCMFVILFIGIIFFNRVEKSFIDTV